MVRQTNGDGSVGRHNSGQAGAPGKDHGQRPGPKTGHQRSGLLGYAGGNLVHTTSVGQQAKQNAELLSDVLDETRYRSGKRTRQIDMSGAERRTSNTPRTSEPETKPDK